MNLMKFTAESQKLIYSHEYYTHIFYGSILKTYIYIYIYIYIYTPCTKHIDKDMCLSTNQMDLSPSYGSSRVRSKKS